MRTGVEVVRAEGASGGELECVAESGCDGGMVELLSRFKSAGLDDLQHGF